MPEARRRFAVLLAVALCGASWGTLRGAGPNSAPAASPVVRMTLDVDWNLPANANAQVSTPAPPTDPGAANVGNEPRTPPQAQGMAGPVTLSLNSGQVLAAVAWPDRPGEAPRKRADGSWTIGSGPSGRVRIRVEAPLHGELSVQLAGQVVPFSLLTLLEGPQRTPSVAPVDVGVERLPWDVIQADWHDGDGLPTAGVVEPGAKLGLKLAYNILAPETADVTLRTHAEIRPLQGGEPLWRDDRQDISATNRLEPAARIFEVVAPDREGTYIVEVRSAWEPIASPTGSRLMRWLRRRRTGGGTSLATRKMTLVVLGARPPAPEAPQARTQPAIPEGVEVDVVDLTRARSTRLIGSGRAPLPDPARASWSVPELALLDPGRRERLLPVSLPGGGRSHGEPGLLGPADGNGLAWASYALKAVHPERPHRVVVTISGGHPSALGVAVTTPRARDKDRQVHREREPVAARVLLDACASGPPILEGGAPATFSWLVWPGSPEASLILINRNPTSPVRVASIRLVELRDLPPNLASMVPPPAAVPAEPLRASGRRAGRSFGLVLGGDAPLERFGPPAEPLAQAENLASYLAHLGTESVVLSEALSDREGRRSLQGQAAEDPLGPDRLELCLRVLGRRNLLAWLALELNGPLGDLPDAASPEAATEGIARLDRQGKPDGPTYQPLHPRVRATLLERVQRAASNRTRHANLQGVVIRLGEGPTLLGSTDTGFDDTTYAAFLAAAFDPALADRIPGRDAADPNRFAARATFVEGAGRQPWLAWRAKQVAGLYRELASQVATTAPGARLAVVTPGLAPGAAGNEARKVDLAGLGPAQAWKAVGLDLTTWPDGPDAPIVWRGAAIAGDDLGHDLATSRELDSQVVARSSRGAYLGLEVASNRSQPGRRGPTLHAMPLADGPAGDELIGHAVAELDARWLLISSQAAAGQEERLRGFARLFSALPAPPDGRPEPILPVGVAARVTRSDSASFLSLANDTPYPIRIEAIVGGVGPNAPVDDIGRGLRLAAEAVGDGRRLVLDLAPYGLSVIAFPGSLGAGLSGVTPYPGSAVLEGMKAQYEGLSGALDRLNRHPGSPPGRGSQGRLAPTDPGFEAESALSAWKVIGPPGARGLDAATSPRIELDPDQKHGGRASLKFRAPAAPASIAGEVFRPLGRSSLTIQAWLRAERPDARVRVWIDGEASGRPFFRQLDVLAQTDWTETAVRSSRLPAGGLDSARVRFELLDPGTLWVDDVAITGDLLNDSERLNARRDLMAALSAYQERRFGDFARLAGSHWTRYVAPETALATVGRPSTEPGLIRTGDASSSALPPERRLR